MSERRNVLTETTLLPISLVGMIVTVAIWVNSIDAKAQRNYENLAATEKAVDYLRDQRQRGDTILSERMREQDKTLREITDRLGRIEGKLDVVQRKLP